MPFRSSDSPPPSDTTPPTVIDIDREHHVSLTWPDGAVARFELEVVRTNCPCAECRGKRERGQAAWPAPNSPQPLTINSAELVGAWGISITWNDGHSTGIYAWEILRRWHDTGEFHLL